MYESSAAWQFLCEMPSVVKTSRQGKLIKTVNDESN